MNKARSEMRAGYRRADLVEGVRGKYSSRYAKGTNLVLINDKLAKAFPTSEAVNAAPQSLLDLTEQTARLTRQSAARKRTA